VGCCPFFDCMNAVALRVICRHQLSVVHRECSKFLCG
jgi:hypothetical protein